MTLEQIGLILLTAGLGSIGWLCQQIWNTLVKLQEKQSDMEIRLNKEFVSYTRLLDIMKPIMDALTDIKESIKEKANK